MTERTRLWLNIDPVDTLFFRDGRPFDPASRVASGLPSPQVLAGALRTALLRRADIDLTQLAGHIAKGERFSEAAALAGGNIGSDIGNVRFRGPWFGRPDPQGGTSKLLYPVPTTLRKVQDGAGSIVRLDPLSQGPAPPGWTPPAPGMVPLWHRGPETLKSVGHRWITAAGMASFLSGTVPKRDDLVAADDLYGFEERTGIAVDPKRQAASDGMIYATRRLVLRPGICLWAEVDGPATALGLLGQDGDRLLLPLGGEGRLAAITVCGAQSGPAAIGAAAPCGPDIGRLLVLVAPAFLGGWKPDGLPLLAAAVPGHVAVSGWDLARGGPKPTRFAVEAGSVYFLPPGTGETPSAGLGDEEDTSVGWGACCEGVWHHAANI